MSIPTPDKVVGQTGHTADHNSISGVLTDHEGRIVDLEGETVTIADVTGLQAALDAKATTVAPTLVGPVEITGDIGSTIFSGDDFLMDVASDNPVSGPGMSMTKRREAAAALEVGDAVGYIGYMKGSDSGGDPTLGLQLHVEVDGTVDAGVVPMALVLSQQNEGGVFEETHRWNSDGTTTPSSGGGGGGGTSVVGEGVFASAILGDSDLTFLGVFDDSVAEDYLIEFCDVISDSGIAEIGFQLLAGSTPIASNYAYRRQFLRIDAAGSGDDTNNLGTDKFGGMFTDSTSTAAWSVQIKSPGKALPTTFIGEGVGPAGGLYRATVMGQNTGSTAATGIRVYPASAITGRWRVYAMLRGA